MFGRIENQCRFIGYVMTDVELEGEGSKQRTNFLLAVPTSKKNGEGQYEDTAISVTLWGRDAGYLCKHGRKGSLLDVICEVSTRTDEETNVKYHNFTGNVVKIMSGFREDHER